MSWVSTVRKAVVGALVGAAGVAAPMVAAGTVTWPTGWMAIAAGGLIGGLSVYVTPNAEEASAARHLVDASPLSPEVKAAIDAVLAGFPQVAGKPEPGVPGLAANPDPPSAP